MMFWLFKRCEHDFKEVEEYIFVDEIGDKYTKTLLYCPKCEKQKRVSTNEWRQKKKIEKIKQQYKT